MRRFFAVFLIPVFFSCNNSNQETKPLIKAPSKHSAGFNSSVQSAMDVYHSMTEAFVNWDSNGVRARAKELQTRLDSIQLDWPSNKDKAAIFLSDAQHVLDTIITNTSIVAQRHGFNSLTQKLYDFLEAVQYDDKTIYLQKCPMAFNDEEEGDWLSDKETIRNPYLGLRHPKYGDAMIDCGDVKDSLNFSSIPNENKTERKDDKSTTNDSTKKSK